MSSLIDLLAPELAANPDIQTHIQSCAWRSYVARANGASIRAVWVLLGEDAFPLDGAVLSSALGEIDEGNALLILSNEVSIRDRAKKIVSGMMLPPGGAA
jgi:hypothetical protein